MMTSHPPAGGGTGMRASEPLWIDLFNASPEEVKAAQHVLGRSIPSREALSEIESSSRLTSADGVIQVSMPILSRDGEETMVSPIGIVLTAHHMVSVRFTELPSFATFAEVFDTLTGPHRCSVGVFLGLFEAIIDRLADVLETIGRELDRISHRIFHSHELAAERRQAPDAALREVLRGIGRMGDDLSKLRDSLLGVARIVPYVAQEAHDWMPRELRPRFQTLIRDVTSLTDYDTQLANKVQFLLDATLGFINIEQNNIFKILTVASIVGIPPTLLAGIWGMNFKSIPELDWAWGYPFAWAMIILSAVVPLVWFRWRRWI